MIKKSRIRFKANMLLLFCLARWSMQQDADSGAPANTDCAQGCLRCHEVLKTCEICDTSTGYVPTFNKKGCEKTAEEHCSLLGNPASCLR